MHRLIFHRNLPCVACAILITSVSAFAQEDEVPESMWQLRDKYTFSGSTANVGYAVDYGDWRVTTPNLGEIFSNVGCQVVLGDGTVVKPRACGKALTTRDRAANPIGPGIVYLTMCPEKDGLKITHKIASYENRSGLSVHLEVQNVGDTPIEIKALQPMVAEPGDISQVRMSSDGPGGPYMFTNASENVAVLLGTIPLGGAEIQLAFNDEGGSITGGAASTFSTPITLAPGDRIETDPFMIEFMYSDPDKAREYFGYTQNDVTGQAPVAEESPAAAEPAIEDVKPEDNEQGKGRFRRLFGRE